MDPAALVIAIVGLLTTATAPILQGLVARRTADDNWRREARAAAYTEALEQAEVAWRFAESTVAAASCNR